MDLKIILIHPPVTKTCEMPAGIARLAACLRENIISYQVIDANLEGTLFLLRNPGKSIIANDKWSVQSVNHIEQNISSLKADETYSNISRYGRKVMDINRVLALAGKPYGVSISLADYQDSTLTPVKISDLIRSAEKPEANPFYPYFSRRLFSLLEQTPDYIGFSLNYLSQALCTFAMIGFIKQRNPSQKIVLGGSLTTSWVKISGKTDIFSGLVDTMIAGAGEGPLLELLGKPGGGQDSMPDYRDFAVDDYMTPARIIPLSASRGCYWHKCSFCPEKAEDNPYVPLSTQTIIDEINNHRKQSENILVHFLDNAISPALMKAMTENQPGTPWYGFTRVTPQLADPDFCLGLKQSGCVMLKLGLESGDQQVLDQLEKGVTIQEMSATLHALRNAGIATYVYLLFGTPAEKEQSAAKTLRFIEQHYDCINFLNLAIFNLPVLSHEAQKLDTLDFYDGDLSLYKNFKHPHGWDRQQVRLFLDKSFKKNTVVSAILKNTPPFFTSNHAPFFIINKAL